MKLLLGAILTLALFVLILCIQKTYNEKHRLAYIVRRILTLGSIIVLANIISLFTNYEWVCLFAYSVYFLTVNWMLYYLLQFSLEYIGNRFDKHVNKVLMLILIFADTLSIALNNIYHHMFYIRPVEVNSESFYELVTTAVFFIHYALSIMLVLFSLITLVYGAVKAPVFYRRKYLAIAIILVVLVVLNFFTFTSAVDVSVIGYVVEGVCIYYCAFVYSPQKLLPRTLLEITQHMNIAIYVIDINGVKFYSNSLADDIFSCEPPITTKAGKTISDWCRDRYMQTDEEFTKEFTFYKEDKEIILKIQLQRMKDGNQQLQGGYFTIQNRTDEIANLKSVRYHATHDSLTNFINKDAFYEQIKKHLKWNPNKPFLIICTDIKDFKIINDSLGTQSGDIVLVNYANMLKTHLKGAYEYARLHNDIFAVLIPKSDFNKNMFPAREDYNLFEGIDKNVTFPIVDYIGIFEITNSDIPASVMCDRARMAISAIKGDIHKRFGYYDNKLRENIVHEQELINDLRPAINDGQFKMFLQPQMSENGTLLGAEALVRWYHPDKGFIMPGDFIPVFERNGLISDVDLFIWETACKHLSKWKSMGREDLHISVNISPKDFYFLNIYQTFTDLVAKYDINPKNLRLEITETAVVMDFHRQMELINNLRANGFIVEMDDFGSGYSSLNMLKDIYVDIIKIDMAFLKNASAEERSRKILEMIITLSNNLNMPVITEGVETKEQVEFLSNIGCHMFQGYYFAKPMDVETFEQTYIN
ncbi:MAG: EAL domain-containing protein [Lachnospira sp.]|nr:EAL domain-containing protein [Lachnospira sp.]